MIAFRLIKDGFASNTSYPPLVLQGYRVLKAEFTPESYPEASYYAGLLSPHNSLKAD